MPLYTYECEKCNIEQDALKTLGDVEEEKCPQCQEPMKRLVSKPAVHFKGSGFHCTDYK